MFVPVSKKLLTPASTMATVLFSLVSTELLCFLSTGRQDTVLFSPKDRKQEAEESRRVNSTGNITSMSVATLCPSQLCVSLFNHQIKVYVAGGKQQENTTEPLTGIQ